MSMSAVNLEAMVSKPTWKMLLLELISTERVDPWDVDIKSVADAFVKRVREMEKMEFSVPANIILASAILLRYKSSVVKLYDLPQQEVLVPLEGEEDGIIEPLPQLMFPSRVPPKRQITLEELVSEMERIIKYDETDRVVKKRGGIEDFVDLKLNSYDLEETMKTTLDKIKSTTDSEGWTIFSRVVESSSPKDILYSLLSVLHLTQKEEVDIKQDVLFGEIFIRVINGKNEKNGKSNGNGKEEKGTKTEKIENGKNN